jgi:type II secretory pathway pseudopilin PulG
LKLSKKSYFIVILGIVASIFAGLWVMRSQQAQEQERLYEELSIAAMRLDNVKSDEVLSQQGELERQISQTLSQLETAKTTLSQSAESINVSGTLFGIAEETGVEITEISSSYHSVGDWEGVTFSVLPLNVTVEGDVPGILSFIGSLDHTLTSAVIKSAVITIPETTSEEKPSANIQLGIYSYQGE